MRPHRRGLRNAIAHRLDGARTRGWYMHETHLTCIRQLFCAGSDSSAATETSDALDYSSNALEAVSNTRVMIRHVRNEGAVGRTDTVAVAARNRISKADADPATRIARGRGYLTSPGDSSIVAPRFLRSPSSVQRGTRPRLGSMQDAEEEARLWSLELSKLLAPSDAPRLAWPLLVMRRGSRIVVALVALVTFGICYLAAQEFASVTNSANAAAGVGLCGDALASASAQTQQMLWSSLGWLHADPPGNASVAADPFLGSANLLALHAAGARANCNVMRWSTITNDISEATTPATYINSWGTPVPRNVSFWRLAMEISAAARVVAALPETSVAAGDWRVDFILKNNKLHEVTQAVLRAVVDAASSDASGVVVALTFATLALAVVTGVATMWLVVLVEHQRDAVLEQLITIPGAVLSLLQQLTNEQEASLRIEAHNGDGGGGGRPGGSEEIGKTRVRSLSFIWAGVSTTMSRRDRERVTRSNPRARIALCARIVAPLFVVAAFFGLLSIVISNTLATANDQTLAASNYIQLKLAVARMHILTSYAAALPDGSELTVIVADAQRSLAAVRNLSQTVFFSGLPAASGAVSASLAVDVCSSTLGLVGDALAQCQAIGGGVLMTGVWTAVKKVVGSCSSVLTARTAVKLAFGGDSDLHAFPSDAVRLVRDMLNGPQLSVSRQLESDGPLQRAMGVFSARQVAVVGATAAQFVAALNTTASVAFAILALYFSLVFLPFMRAIQRDIDASKLLLRLLPPAVAVRLVGVRTVMAKLTEQGSAIRIRATDNLDGGGWSLRSSSHTPVAPNRRRPDSMLTPAATTPGGQQSAPLRVVPVTVTNMTG